MHILVTNDDGPPSQQSSPYVHSLVKTLQDAGHTVSVIVPHVQRSWIGKAHFVGQMMKPTYFRPGNLHKDDGTFQEQPFPKGSSDEEWVLIDGTPGTCAQLGLYHFFQDRGPVDLVVSGPNYGRNSTALFSLSSGTIGGAMEAATCRKKAIALSYAFYSRDHDPAMIAGASRLSVRVIEYLYNNWGQDVDLYSINVPLIENVENHKVMYTNILQNYWTSGSPFQEVEANEVKKPEQQEKEIRQQQPRDSTETNSSNTTTHTPMLFKWAPKFNDIHKSVEASPPGNDGWALKEGYTSVTPLKANFMHASSSLYGEMKLPPERATRTPHIHALIAHPDPYVQPLILSALPTHLPSLSSLASLASLPYPIPSPLLIITSYETLPFSHILAHPTTTLANAYVIRKALIRKHYLAATLTSYLTKHPEDPLRQHIPLTVAFELDYAEFLDDALVEAWELHESFARNSPKPPQEREWWILKPSMADRGQGIRLFSTSSDLRAIFSAWEAANPETDSDSDAASPEAPHAAAPDAGVMTSQLRHFVAQPYIPPLLFPALGKRKFHIRAYVLAIGALKVFVYREMLALFAAVPYVPPGAAREGEEGGDGGGNGGGEDGDVAGDMRGHLTNTCLQNGTREGSVLRFWDLPSGLPSSTTTTTTTSWLLTTFSAICTSTSSLFRAAAAQPTTFQALPNAFEVFGVDWLVDSAGQVWLLEVNAFPDFGQSGEVGREVVAGLWNGVLGECARWYEEKAGGRGGEEMGVGERDEGEEEWGMRKVLDLYMGRG